MRVVITAEGIVSAIGTSAQDVLSSLRAKRSGIGVMRHLHSTHTELPVGEVPLSDEAMKTHLGIDVGEEVSRTALMGMMAIEQLRPALPAEETIRRTPLRVVLVSGTTVGTMDVTERHFAAWDTETDFSYLRYHGCGGSTARMADHFGFFSDYTTLSTACSSAANAILLGARLLKAGLADLVVAGGSEALSRFHLNGFNALMILDKERCRPFDATRAGLNLGEGAAYVLMETEESARRRGADIHAWLTGYGNACDAYHQTASSEGGDGAFLAMTEALRMAGLRPEEVQYVNAHGTGTPNNDQSESAALYRVFGDRMPLVSSTKAFTGHTTSASGSIESVICLLAMRYGFAPANLGWREQMPDGITPTSGADDVALTHVLCNAFGFGGNDTSLVFSSVPSGDDGMSIPQKNGIRVLSRVEITSEEALAEIRQYVRPLEARRMGRLMKASLLASLKALHEAGVDMPDAIVTGTAYGCLENTERLLYQLRDEGEAMLSPTHFMQSTHNTLGSTIAIRLGCHGYNATYSQRGDSLRWAMLDAEMLLRSGRCRTVLVGCHDEATPLLRHLLDRLGLPCDASPIHSVALVMTCGE